MSPKAVLAFGVPLITHRPPPDVDRQNGHRLVTMVCNLFLHSFCQ
jgi:hypothetical protein